VSELADVIDRLAAAIAARRGADPAKSWSARLIADPRLAAKKLAEEAVEAALAAVSGDRPALIAEAADVIYHLLALLEGAHISLDSVAAELRAREGRSGVEEKASRKD
jgi:phosphoribosyl-ATP pyrophosphohydrolase